MKREGAERAVVVMGKLPVPGRVKTRLRLPPEVAATLYRAFLEDVFALVEIALAKRAGQAVFACALEPGDRLDEARALAPPGWSVVPQREGDLGARMRGAWLDGQAGCVLVIGSDLPTLPPARLVEAFDAARPGRAVFVPALDGGYVLVGLTEDAPALFEGIAWSTSTVLEATEAKARAAGLEVLRLEPQADVDEPADLDRLLREVGADTRTKRVLDRLVREGWLSEPDGAK